MAVSKIYESDLENITNIMGVPLAGWIHFIPNEFSGPLGAEWIDAPENTGTYEVTGGQLVITQSGTQLSMVYQTFEDPSFDIWTKFSVSNTGLSGVYNRYNFGNIAIYMGPYGEWNFPYADLYLQYNFDTVSEYSLAIYTGENAETVFEEDPYIPDGFDIYNSEIYFRIKYTVGDVMRIYWSQGGEWVEIDTGLSMIPTTRKDAILAGGCANGAPESTASFDFIRKHNEIPFEPV